MQNYGNLLRATTTALLATTSLVANAQFETGSTGIDGALDVTENITLPLPPDGTFHFTTVSVARNTTLTFQRNMLNTPVRILATGDVMIEGTIEVSGEDGNQTAAIPRGGPGGFAGGALAMPGSVRGFNGLGPGAGRSIAGCGGMGGGHATASPATVDVSCRAALGQPYGRPAFGVLVGGSGGAGTPAIRIGGGSVVPYSGGGGGGAIHVASPTRILVSRINANGGDGGGNGFTAAFGGGGGSGGTVQLVAPVVSAGAFGGRVTALGGSAGLVSSGEGDSRGGAGAVGRIIIAANTVEGGLASFTPSPMLVRPRSPLPQVATANLRITSVDGFGVPVEPTGENDVLIPGDSPATITVEFETTNVPLGERVTLTAMPAIGDPITVLSTPIEGSMESGTAQADIELPTGQSSLTASLSYSLP